MTPENIQLIMDITRRIAFAGLVLLCVWLILLVFRGAVPDGVIDLMDSGDRDISVSYDSSTWDWGRSISQDASVSEIIGPRLGITLRLIGLTGLFSLVLSVVLMSLGVLIKRITDRPAGWHG